MKRILAGLLAVVTMVSVAGVAFAVEEPDIYIDPSDEYFVSDREGRAIRTGDDLLGNVTVEPGRTLYIPLSGEDSTSSTAVKRMNVYVNWIVGSTDAPTIVHQKTYDAGTREDEDGDEVATIASLGYKYMVAVRIPDAGPTKAVDLCGTIKVARSTSQAKKLEEGQYVELNLTAEYQQQNATSSNYILRNNDAPLIEFDENGIVEIAWGEKEDLAVFEVDVTGQDKLNLAFDTKYNRTIAQKYDYANLDFLNFQQTPTFNKTGLLYIYGEDTKYLYQITDSGDLRVPDYLYDANYGAFRLRTRTLGNYVISDRKLGDDAKNIQSSSSTPASSISQSSSSPSQNPNYKYNPDTGR